MPTIRFEVSPADDLHIIAIAERAFPLYANRGGLPVTFMALVMDLTACHANGTPLDLAGLLAAPAADFAHDISGIVYHMDRDTGTLADCFLPRYATRTTTEV